VARWKHRAWLAAALAAAATTTNAAGLTAQSGRDPSTVVIATGGEPSLPVPTLMEGPLNNQGNTDIADQLFLRLAELGPTLMTSGDRAFVPALARSWTRRDSVTLAFDLDPRAVWHDGAPVTARDVVFTFGRARNPAIAPGLAKLLRHITGVTAEGDRRVVFHYDRPYGEQLYDAAFHVAPLPAHLLAALPPDSLARSPFVRAPVGSGAYRWVRQVPGEFVELAANERFFLGAPAIRRVIFRVATDADARLNLVLSGEADVMDNIPPPRDNIARVSAQPRVRIIPFPSPTVGYLLFNQRDPRDTTRPHPILSDPDVRRAIGLALDRRQMVRATFGNTGEVPFGPASALLLWIRHGATPARPNVALARRLLSGRGWADHDGDGTLDRDGVPLALTLLTTNTSAVRFQLAQQAQEQLRQVGIRVAIDRRDWPLYNGERSAGRFDLDFASATQDPSPSGLVQSWSCQGPTNFARYCDPAVDSLLDQAQRSGDRAGETYLAALRRIESDAPAVFMYALSYLAIVDRRFGNVRIRPESLWLALREWIVTGRGSVRSSGR
jgi:peptide/nickel transport system substrate-binding protein